NNDNNVVHNIWSDIFGRSIISWTLNLLRNIQTLNNVAKEIIILAKRFCIITRVNKKLTTVRIRPRIGHSNRACCIVTLNRLIIKLVTWTTSTISFGITTLNNLIRQDTMELYPIIKVVLSQENEIIDRVRRKSRIKFHNYQSTVRID